MTKKDISELKRRMTKENCTFTKLRGCYVDSEKNILLTINETFLNLIDEEFYKYLEIAKKTLSGTIGNNILELSFLPEEENNSGKQQFFRGLKESKLKNDALLERFYELIIKNYNYSGNYLILIFHDNYDIIKKTNDNNKLDESEEVYEYLLCSICPVNITKAGLGYIKSENRIGARIRDWIVSLPDIGFVFPAFSERSSNINSIIYYVKDSKNSNPEFMKSVLGCTPKLTASEEKKTFHTILENSIENTKYNTKDILIEVHKNLNDIIEENKLFGKEHILLTDDTIHNIISKSNLPEETVSKIEKCCSETFGNTPPIAENLIDNKTLSEAIKIKKEKELEEQINNLKQQLKETKSISNNEDDSYSKTEETENYDIVLNVKPQKISQIKSQIIDGKKYILIPVDNNEQTAINGIDYDDNIE